MRVTEMYQGCKTEKMPNVMETEESGRKSKGRREAIVEGKENVLSL